MPISSPEAVSTITRPSRPAERSETWAAGNSSGRRGTYWPPGRSRRWPALTSRSAVAFQPAPEVLAVARHERALVRRAEDVGGVDLLVLVVEDRVLDRAVEELVGVAAEELVERVLARDVDRQAAPAPAGAAPLLAQARDGARERDADRRVERADVDAELERVGGDDAEQLAVDQLALELAPLLRGVARAVGRDALGELGMAEVVERELRELRHQLDRLARLHEDDRARALHDQLGEQVGGLGEHRAAGAELLVGDRRVPHRDRALGHRGAVALDHGEVLEAGQALGQLARVADRGGGHEDPRLGAVGAGDAAQAAQDVADVGAEDAAVDVRLVDHDDREVGEEVRPRGVVREDPEVEHVGVGEDDVGVAADRGALLPRRCRRRRSRAARGRRRAR